MSEQVLEQLERRVPEILAAGVRERRVVSQVWTCAAPGVPEVGAMAPAPPRDDPGWRLIRAGERWGTAPGDDPDREPPRLPWQIPATGGSTHWLRLDLAVPAAWHGHAVHLVLHWDGSELDQVESTVYLNGATLTGLDWGHRSAQLPASTHAAGGEIMIRCAVAFPRPFGGVELQLRDEIIFRLGHTLRTLLEAARALPLELPAHHAIAGMVRQAYESLDLRAGWQSAAFAASAAVALAELEASLATQAPLPQSPAIVASGHGHLDVAWLWPLWRTRQKAVHTVAIALDLMERYPDYHFSMSQPQVFAYLKQDDPALYTRLAARVAEGRFEPVGMMWVEPDCNLPSGEALIRQLIHGARFFAREFPERYGAGMEAPHVVWLPDVFGFNAALPQILRGCGITCFMTTKLSWNQANRYPAETFRWRGIDGSEVLAHFLTTTSAPPRHRREPQPFAYGGTLTAGEVAGAWRHYQQQELNRELLVLFGHGDGGGGPAEEMLESLRILEQIPGLPRVRPGRADRFFADLYARVWDDPRLPRWSGELYLEYHRGTYTSQAAIKRANRAAELQYREAEWLNAWAASMGHPSQQARLDTGWSRILLNQFHDILPGTSIAAVYRDAHAAYAEARQIGAGVIGAALEALTAELPGEPLIINSLPWDRSAVVGLPAGGMTLPVGPDLAALDMQVVAEQPGEETLLVAVDMPACGYAALGHARRPHSGMAGILSAHHDWLASDEIELTLDQCGEIRSLYDRRHGRELVLPGQSLNQLVLYEDRPLAWDAWDIDPFYTRKPYPVQEVSDWQVVETGPLRAAIEIRRSCGPSTIIQRIVLWRDSRRIDLVTTVDWQERQMLLRALFPLAINATHATCEIQFGAIERPVHRNTSWDQARFEVCAHRWVDLSEGDYGVALLNDGIYGHSLDGSTLGISLLKGAIFPDPDADRGAHRFTYSLLPHAGDWRAARVTHQAYELNAPLRLHGRLDRWEPDAAPGAPVARSFLRTSADHVVVETIKVADDGDGIIVRLYEAHNQRGPVTLTFDRPVRSAEETDMLERSRGPAAVAGHEVHCTVRPFEIKTLRVRLG